MPFLLDYIVSRITEQDPRFAQSLAPYIAGMDGVFRERAESFFRRYERYLASRAKTIDFGISCFARMRASVEDERIKFLRSGEYSSKSFEEVNRRVYGNPDIMDVHMHGLVFAQFLWPDQYRRFSFFCENLPAYRESIRSYLEIGGGHALYFTEAIRALNPETTFDLVDISPSSMALAQGIVDDSRAQYHLMNIFDFPADRSYDFITLGEVLEHLEEPRELLMKVHALLSPEGRAYITTPVNAPMVDHIYLFNDVDEIRTLFQDCGFAIDREVQQYAVNLPERRCVALKVALMYGAFVKKALPSI
jgi:2-polyprenyl-3-methyl-5-hydroxy-6-metoxy-1,4-benzoquinol methylase